MAQSFWWLAAARPKMVAPTFDMAILVNYATAAAKNRLTAEAARIRPFLRLSGRPATKT